MKDYKKYVGLDVSKETIAVRIADEGREDLVYGTIKNTSETIKKLMRKLGNQDEILFAMKLDLQGMEYTDNY